MLALTHISVRHGKIKMLCTQPIYLEVPSWLLSLYNPWARYLAGNEEGAFSILPARFQICSTPNQQLYEPAVTPPGSFMQGCKPTLKVHRIQTRWVLLDDGLHRIKIQIGAVYRLVDGRVRSKWLRWSKAHHAYEISRLARRLVSEPDPSCTKGLVPRLLGG